MKNHLTQEQIEQINKDCPYNQGIFVEPFGIPNEIKEPVIYTKWESASRGGSCWDDIDTEHEDNYYNRPKDVYKVFDLVLKILKPNIELLEYQKIIGSIQSNQETDYGYYGDYTEETIEWLPLSKLYEILEIK